MRASAAAPDIEVTSLTCVLGNLAEVLDKLARLSDEIDHSLGDVIADQMSREAVRSLQQIDLLRQSLSAASQVVRNLGESAPDYEDLPAAALTENVKIGWVCAAIEEPERP